MGHCMARRHAVSRKLPVDIAPNSCFQPENHLKLPENHPKRGEIDQKSAGNRVPSRW